MGKYSSYITFLVLMAWLAFVKLALTYGNFPSDLFAHPGLSR
jgi:hypothetical protein